MTVRPFNPFYSAYLRIKRAEEHLDDLEAQINEFFAANPYIVAVEDDPDGIHQIHKIQFTQRFPFRWRILATEIIEHLRAALDHATWVTGHLSSGNPDIQQVAFPFAGVSDKLDDSIRRRSKNLPPEIIALLRTFHPYQGGNEALSMLNDLCNQCKHVLVAFIAHAARDLQITGSGWTAPVQFYDPPTWDRAKNEIKYARVPRGAQFQHQASLKVFVAIEYRDVASPHAATAVLNAMHREVQRVVGAIEAESRRIGLLK